MVAATAGGKKTGEQLRELWIDSEGRKIRMAELDSLKERNKDLIEYFKNGTKRK